MKFICDHLYKIQRLIAIILLLTGSLVSFDKIVGGHIAPFATLCTHVCAPSAFNNIFSDVARRYQNLYYSSILQHCVKMRSYSFPILNMHEFLLLFSHNHYFRVFNIINSLVCYLLEIATCRQVIRTWYRGFFGAKNAVLHNHAIAASQLSWSLFAALLLSYISRGNDDFKVARKRISRIYSRTSS